MLDELDQMMEISKALNLALDAGDVDRVISLLKKRQELTEHMGHPRPNDPDVESGKVAEKLKELVEFDGTLEQKLKSLMGTLENAIKTVQGEKKIVKGYIKQSGESEPRYLDKEG